MAFVPLGSTANYNNWNRNKEQNGTKQSRLIAGVEPNPNPN